MNIVEGYVVITGVTFGTICAINYRMLNRKESVIVCAQYSMRWPMLMSGYLSNTPYCILHKYPGYQINAYNLQISKFN